jgi:hypothetical protein
MTERRPQDGRRFERCGKRLGRTRGDNAVATGHHDESRSAQQLWAHRIACDPPQAASGLVVAVPGLPTVARCPKGQRHAVVDPILQGNEPTRLITLGLKDGKPPKFAFCRKGIEKKEESLDHLDRHAVYRTVDAGETIRNEGKKPPPPVLGRASRPPMQYPTMPTGAPATSVAAAKAASNLSTM